MEYTGVDELIRKEHKVSLINCPECGKQISSLADCCINCGFPLSKLEVFSASKDTTDVSNHNMPKDIVESEEYYEIDFEDENYWDKVDEIIQNEIKIVKIKDGTTEIPEEAFYGDEFAIEGVILPTTIKKIGREAFSLRTLLNEIQLPSGIEQIEDGSFSFCTNLKRIDIPGTIRYIGDGAFNNSGVEIIQINPGVEIINEGAFKWCSKLRSIDIPEGVVSICKDAFEECSELKTIKLPKSLISIDEALERLKNGTFPDGINAVIFLLHKPAGQGDRANVLSPDDPRVKEFFSEVDNGKHKHKIGMDSCCVPGLVNNCTKVMPEALDTCEGGRFSCYVSADMKLIPCSFDQNEKYAVSLEGKTIEEAWNSEEFEAFRYSLRHRCPDCKVRESCMGGCPLMPEVVLCKRDTRFSSGYWRLRDEQRRVIKGNTTGATEY